jgi:hypothetical protein
LRPHEGHTVVFEAGYTRHIEWRRQPGLLGLVWLERHLQRATAVVRLRFVRASDAILDSPVAPSDDERDNVLNVLPHAEFMGNALYEYLPDISRGTGEPQPAVRIKFTTVDLVPGAAKAFVVALRASQSTRFIA